MTTTIKIKSTTTAGKIPTTSDLEIAELGLNLADEKLYSRNSSGIFEIGKPGEVPSGGTPDRPTTPELGDLFYDITIDALLYWNGSEWVPVGGEALALNDLSDVDTTGVTDGMVIAYDQASGEWKPVSPASLSVDVDLGYTPAASDGTVTNTAGDDATIPAATETEAGLMTAADKRKLEGIDPGAEVNPDLTDYLQKGDNVSDLVNDAGYITDADVGDGTITLTKADGTEIGSFTVNQAGDTDIALPADAVPSAPGDGKLTIKDADGVTLGEFTADQATGTDTEVVLPAIGDGKITIVDADGEPVGDFTVNQAGDKEISLPAIPVPEDQIHIGDTYPGTPSLGDLWVDTTECPPVLNIWSDCDGTEGWKPIGGGNTDVINFTALITDDGTPEANTPGHVLTAVAQNITGGTAPVEYEYKWLVDGLTMGTAKTLNIIQTFVGKIVTCEITVAEPDGSDPVTKIAVYSKIIEVAGTINTPSVLQPEDGAGSGAARYPKSDTIINVEDVGGGQTKLTVAGPTDLADMTGAGFMSDGNPAGGPYTQTPYKLVTTDIENVTIDSREFTGLASEWNYNGVSAPGHYPTGLGPFDPNPNSYVYFPGVQDRVNAYADIDLLPVAEGSEIQVDWQGSGPENYRSTILQLINKNGVVVLETPFDNPTANKNQANRINAGKLSGTIEKLRLKLNPNDDGSGISAEYIGGFAGLYVDGEKFVAGTYEQIILTFPGDVSTNPDLQYFKGGDVIANDLQQLTSLGFSMSDKSDAATFYVSRISIGGKELVDQTALASASVAFDPDTMIDIGTATSNQDTGSGQSQPNAWANGKVQGTNSANDVLFDFRGGDKQAFIEWTTPVDITGDVEITCCVGAGYANKTATIYKTKDRLVPILTTAPLIVNVHTPQIADIDESALVHVISTGYPDSNTMVVDGGEWNNGDVVEYQTNGGQGDIVSVNTDDNTILLSETGDRDNRWIAENKAGTDFYVAGPSIIDDPLLTADVELQSTDFATTPENTDTLKNIVWELNGAEQNAGVSNPYKPTLNTNTTYTVRVKHQGNSLNDSAWSTATTFTTGATRNLYTYYKERVELLESRLASIEADEVNDDATDTVLITTVANLLERIEQLEGGA